MKEFLSVKEFSKLSGIETTTLRYWDEIGLFSPAKRDPENNYRYYSPQQVIAVNFISVLSSLKIPLKAIEELKHERTPENILDLIEYHENILDMEMRRIRESYSIMHTRRELIKLGIRADVTKVELHDLDERMLILGAPNDFVEGEDFIEPFMKFCRSANDLRINLSFPICGYHNDLEYFLTAPGRPNHFCSIDPTGNVKMEAGTYMVGCVRGFYGELEVMPERLMNFASANSLEVSGPVFTIYLHDEICLVDPANYLAAVYVPVKK